MQKFNSIHDLWAKIDRVCVTTHAGYIGRFPENSLVGLAAAVESGSDFVEFDLRASADHVIMLQHDPTLERTSNGKGAFSALTCAELKKLNFSYYEYFIDCSGRTLASPRFKFFPITSFDEVLTTLRDKVFMNIQVYAEDKRDLEIICAMFREFDMYERAYLTMCNYEEAQVIRNIDPEIELCVLDRPTTMAALHTMRDFGCRVAQPLWTDMTPEYCETSRELGIFSNVYYANLTRDIKRYAEMGIQGILTDYTEHLIEYNHNASL